MPQSNIIFGFLFAAFVVFITQRGELPIYLGFLFNAAPPSGGDLTIKDVTGDTSNADGTNTADTYGQGKANTYFNAIKKNLFGS